MTIPLQPGAVYGPMNSRRFGRSLGINLLPTDSKVCSFDCVYCQYGKTSDGTPVFARLSDLDKEIDAVFCDTVEQNMKMDWIMIAGNGEPTLHPQFPEVVDSILKYRDLHLYKVPVGILSNSSTCFIPSVKQALLKLDGRFMKLDAGGPRVFDRINQPSRPDLWPKILDGLHELKSCVLQSLFVRGAADNTAPADLDEWITQVCLIQPAAVQVYSIQRPTKDQGILPVAKKKLESIAKQLTDRTGIGCRVYD
ncbi:MAG: hypothetical protein WCG06_03490 [Candidatus Omnitrophota bacterium]